MIPSDVLERMVKLTGGPIDTPYGPCDGEVVYIVDDGRGGFASRFGFTLAVFGEVSPNSRITAGVRKGETFVPADDAPLKPLRPEYVCRVIEALPPASGEVRLDPKDLRRALSIMPEFVYFHVEASTLTMGANGTIVTLPVLADTDVFCRVSRDLLRLALSACTERMFRLEIMDIPGRPARTLLAWLEPGFRMYIMTATYLHLNALQSLRTEDCLRVGWRDGSRLICLDHQGSEVVVTVDQKRRLEIRRIGLNAYYRLQPDILSDGSQVLPGTLWGPRGVTVVGRDSIVAIDLENLIRLA